MRSVLARYNTPWVFTGLFVSLAVIFIIHSWIVTNGLPYHSDANESFSAYVQGQNMLNFDPTKNSFLPDDGTGKHESAHPFTYTHGPNLPRYFSSMMSLLDISFSYQILLSAIFSLFLSVWFIIKSFPEAIASTRKGQVYSFSLLIIALLCFDFLGTLQFIVNLWRMWHFPLFWGCVWAVRTNPKKPWVFLLFFLVFQLEFLFALFTFCSCAIYYMWTYLPAWKKGFGSVWITMLVASLSSLGTFAAQLISFYGLKGFLFDLKTTYVARNTNTIEWESIREFYEAHSVMMWPSSPEWNFRFPVFLKVTFECLISKLSPAIAFLCLGSLLLSLALYLFSKRVSLLKAQRSLFSLNTSVFPLLWSMVVTYLIFGLILPGYTLNGYVHRWAPLLVFPVILALALLVGNLADIILACMKEERHAHKFQFYLTAILAGAGLFLWILMSESHYQKYPDFVHSPAKILSTKYKGHSFVSGTTFPHMIAQYTGKWSYYSPLVFPGDKKLDQTYNWNADRNKNREYETPEYYLCEVLPYNGYLNCGDVVQQMVALGHILVEEGAGYHIIKLNWKLSQNKE